MAQMIPDSIPRTATAGEKLLFKTLKEALPEEFIVYYEPEIKGRRPDFLIMAPELGLLVLEVKDYTRNTLVNLNKNEWLIQYGQSDITTVKSPLKQARENIFHIADYLQKEKSLLNWDDEYKGRLKFPYGYGTVFTRLTQAECVNDQLYHVIEPHFMLTREEIDPDKEGFSHDRLLAKLYGMFPFNHVKRRYLTEDDIHTIRFYLFPEVRISANWNKPRKYREDWLLSLTDLKTMDLHQENMAKQIGEEHRLIRGVAGSGKTLILASRVKTLLKSNPDWKILVLCFNISLSNMIRQMIDEKLKEPEDLIDLILKDDDQKSAHVEVYNYHEFISKKGLKENEELSNSKYPLYDAILIDEGQDFEPEWLKIISKCLNPETKSLLIVEDRAQNIYKRKWNLRQQTGLDFRGRSRYLSINYRNTAEILHFAWNFYQDNSNVGNKTDKIGDTAEIIPPRQTQRTGPEPIVCKASNFEEEIQFVCKSIVKLHEQYQVPYSEMIILYRIKNNQSTPYVDILKNVLEQHELPYFWISENNLTKRKFIKKEDSIKISTIESAKGLDFRAVFVIHIENMPFALVEDEEREAALLYIAMTRAVEWLFLSYTGKSKYTNYLEKVSNVFQPTIKVSEAKQEMVALIDEVAVTSEVETIENQEKQEKEESERDMAKSSFDVLAFTKGNHNPLIFETLRGWRKQKAVINKVPPYTILEDKSLLILATFIPHTQEEFLSLPFFKQKRWENYGEELLDILKKYEKTYDIFKYFPRYVQVASKVEQKQEEQKEDSNSSLFKKIIGIFK